MSKIYSGELIGKRESVTDQLLLLNPYQTPLIAMLGFSDPAIDTNHIWYEDSMYSTKAKVTAAAADETALSVSEVEPFRASQVVKVDEELILVTGVDDVSKKIAVMRGYAGTTATPIAKDAIIEVQYVMGTEGADARQGRNKQRLKKSNITQIFDETITITGTAAAVANYGIDDLYEYEKAKKLLELALQAEKAFIGGVLYENGFVRQMNGIRSMLKSNVANLNGEALTMDVIQDSLQDIFTAGGFAGGGNYEIIVPAKQKRVIGKFSENQIRIPNGDDTRATVVNTLITDFGEFPVSINGNLSADEVLIIDKNRTKIKPLKEREFNHEYLGKKGDYYEGQIIGEYTLELHQEAAHARIKGAKH